MAERHHAAIAGRRTVDDGHDPVPHRLADTMLLEIDRSLAVDQAPSAWRS